MALNIKDPETDLMVRQLAALTGERISDAVKIAVGDRPIKERRRRDRGDLDPIQAIVPAYQSKDVVDPRATDDVVTDPLRAAILPSSTSATASPMSSRAALMPRCCSRATTSVIPT